VLWDPLIIELCVLAQSLSADEALFCMHNSSLYLIYKLSKMYALLGERDKILSFGSLAAVVKNRPIFYDRVLPALLDFDPGLETAKGAHSASLRFSLRTAFLGFLRCPHQAMIEVSSSLRAVL
jgi:symplekin